MSITETKMNHIVSLLRSQWRHFQNVPSDRPIFFRFFSFHLMKLKVDTEGNQSVLISNFRSKMRF